MLDGPISDPSSEPDIPALQVQLDRMYEELLTVPALEPDAALRRLATLTAWASGVRGRLSRSPGRATSRFVTAELEPFLLTLDLQTRLIQRAALIQRGSRR